MTDDDSYCTTTDFEFIAVDMTYEMVSQVSQGVIGLGPNSKFIEKLVQGTDGLNLKIFYFHLFSQYYDNYFEVGRSDIEGSYSRESASYFYKWAYLYGGAEYWGAVLRSSSIPNLISEGVVFKTTSRYDYLPNSDILELRDYFNTHNSALNCAYSTSLGTITCDCDLSKTLNEQFPNVNITIGSGNKIVKLIYVPSSYMTEVSTASTQNCQPFFRSGKRYT